MAAGLTVITTVLIAAGHPPAPSGSLVVRVNVTVPLAIDGVYVEVSEVTSEKVPLGALHVELVAVPPIPPARVTVPPAHTAWGVPALAVAAGLTVITTVLVAAGHGPAPSGSFVVSVSVTVPLAIDGV